MTRERKNTGNLQPPMPKLGLKVGVLLPQDEPFDRYQGGAIARCVHEIYRLLPPEQIAFTVFAFDSLAQQPYPLAHSSSWFGRWLPHQSARVQNNWLTRKLLKRKGILWCLSLMPQLKHCQVLHIHNRPLYVLWLRRFGYRGRIVLHMHNNHISKLSPGQLDKLASRVDSVITVSDYIRRQIAASSQRLANKSVTVHNGVNQTLYRPGSGCEPSEQAEPTGRVPGSIVFVGRVVADKGVHILLQAIEQLLHQGQKLQLSVIGGSRFGSTSQSSYEQKCHQHAAKLNQQYPGSVQFTGYLANDKLAQELGKAEIFCAPSVWDDPCPLAPLEAMAAGLPVVATRSGGIPETVGDAGILVGKGAVDELREALGKLLQDPALRAQLAAAACQQVDERLRWEHTARHIHKQLLG